MMPARQAADYLRGDLNNLLAASGTASEPLSPVHRLAAHAVFLGVHKQTGTLLACFRFCGDVCLNLAFDLSSLLFAAAQLYYHELNDLT